MASRQANKQAPRQSRRKGELPESGFFAQADPRAEVYVPRGGQDNTDVTKRGGRYTSDFVWNTKWQDTLDRQQAREEAELAKQNAPQEAKAGGLSFSRVSDMQSLDVDLTAQLQEAQLKHEQRLKEAAVMAAAASARRDADVPPTQGEARRWLRSGRYSRKVVALAPANPEATAALAAQQAAEEKEYQRLKAELQTWCQGTAFACFVATVIFYSKDTAASYGVGAVGSLAYLRMLNRSIDSVGGFTVGAALGQPRLLVPIILTAAFNRWNTLAAHDVGITLQLLPMLLGFFTYKAAVIAKTGLSLLDSISKGSDRRLTSETAVVFDEASAAPERQGASLDATYAQRVLTR
ncbi:hypothetical protein WJX77_006920 [Trebouxia sp. C0004]